MQLNFIINAYSIQHVFKEETKEKPKSDQDFAENLILLLAFTKGEKKNKKEFVPR